VAFISAFSFCLFKQKKTRNFQLFSPPYSRAVTVAPANVYALRFIRPSERQVYDSAV
jgi:hypothetical protein